MLGSIDTLRRGLARKVIREFGAHYHLERNHEALGNRLIMPEAVAAHSDRFGPETPATGWNAELLPLPPSGVKRFTNHRGS